MKRTFFHITLLVGLVLAAISQSCTNLDEKLYGTVSADNFPKTQEEFISTLGAAYTALGGYASGDVNNLQEVTTDEEVVPTRGSDWDDGGNWRRLHLHSWKFEDGATGGAWDFCFGGVSTCNRLIYQFQTLATAGSVDQATADKYVAELTALRGFFYWQLVDLYGNVPIVTDFATAPAAPATSARKDVYDFIITDLTSALPNLPKTVDGTTYGRMTYYGAYMILAKLYLNAGVYTGTPHWDKVIAACDTIINSGKYSLESNYFTNFNVSNSGSKEFIFAIPYDKIYYKGFNLPMQTLHYGSQYTYNLTGQPWNGFCTLEEFYNSYSAGDLRKGEPGTLISPSSKRGNFVAGFQWAISGGLVTDAATEGLAKDPDGEPLNLGNIGDGIPQINELGPGATRQSGVRIGKWEFEIGGTTDMSNDFAVFRYADVLLMKAEALMRSGNTASALALVNQIRARAGVPDLVTLDGPMSYDLTGPSVTGGELLNEMGREMFAEHNRRQDLIRFGQFLNNDKWTIPFNNPGDVNLYGAGKEYLYLFPINKAKLAANSNLIQNPGYPTTK